MQREGTETNGRSAACHGLSLVLDLNQKVLKFLVILPNCSLSFSLCFRTSVDVFLMLFNCSISMTLPYLWKT